MTTEFDSITRCISSQHTLVIVIKERSALYHGALFSTSLKSMARKRCFYFLLTS